MSKLIKYCFIVIIIISSVSFVKSQTVNIKELRIPLDYAMVGNQEDFLTNIGYVPLEAKITVERPMALVIMNENIYLSSNENIFIFDLAGKFLKKIELYSTYKSKIINVISRIDNELIVYLKGGTIVYLDTQGKEIKSEKISSKILDSARIANTDWIVNKPLKNVKDFLVQKENNLIKFSYPFLLDKKGNSPILMSDYKGFVSGNFQNSNLIYYPFMNDIIEIKDDNNILIYKMIYPDKNTFNFTESDFSDPNNYLKFINSNENFISFYRVLWRYDSGILFSPNLAKKYKDVYSYDIDSGNIINLSKLSINQKTKNLPVFSLLGVPIFWNKKDNFFYTLIYSEDIQSNISSLSMKNKLVQKVLNNKNPTLVKFQLKK